MLDSYTAKNYEYNGVKMTEYEASQKQREIERNTRRWKREESAMCAAGLPTDDAKSRVKWWKDQESSFLKQTGLKPQTARSHPSRLITGRNAVTGINTPYISSSENRYKNYLDKLYSKNGRLNRAHKDIVRNIPSVGDWAYFAPGKVSLQDLAALTVATGDEFALFAGNGKAMIIHGTNGRWNIPALAWDDISNDKLIWVGHSHPTTINLRASGDDRKTLRTYFTWQEFSSIIDVKGNVIGYTGSIADEINELLGVM